MNKASHKISTFTNTITITSSRKPKHEQPAATARTPIPFVNPRSVVIVCIRAIIGIDDSDNENPENAPNALAAGRPYVSILGFWLNRHRQGSKLEVGSRFATKRMYLIY